MLFSIQIVMSLTLYKKQRQVKNSLMKHSVIILPKSLSVADMINSIHSWTRTCLIEDKTADFCLGQFSNSRKFRTKY